MEEKHGCESTPPPSLPAAASGKLPLILPTCPWATAHTGLGSACRLCTPWLAGPHSSVSICPIQQGRFLMPAPSCLLVCLCAWKHFKAQVSRRHTRAARLTPSSSPICAEHTNRRHQRGSSVPRAPELGVRDLPTSSSPGSRGGPSQGVSASFWSCWSISVRAAPSRSFCGGSNCCSRRGGKRHSGCQQRGVRAAAKPPAGPAQTAAEAERTLQDLPRRRDHRAPAQGPHSEPPLLRRIRVGINSCNK